MGSSGEATWLAGDTPAPDELAVESEETVDDTDGEKPLCEPTTGDTDDTLPAGEPNASETAMAEAAEGAVRWPPGELSTELIEAGLDSEAAESSERARSPGSPSPFSG
jgi:hypothetical protein